MTVRPLRIMNDSIGDCDDTERCGTKRKCKSCTFHMFLSFMKFCSGLYCSDYVSEEEIVDASKVIMEHADMKDIDTISRAWGMLLENLDQIPIRKRAGMRRGFDILTVASMSRY